MQKNINNYFLFWVILFVQIFFSMEPRPERPAKTKTSVSRDLDVSIKV